MTLSLSGETLAERINQRFPGSAAAAADTVLITAEYLTRVAGFLKDSPDLLFNYLADLTAVDYYDYFEIVYRLTSLQYNHALTLKVCCEERENPVVPSVTGIWQGADYMEREIFDLMGIRFDGHPNLKRIFTWEGFSGHPLRKEAIQ